MFQAGYRQRILKLHQELGIPEDYEEQFCLALQYEAEHLVDAGYDMFGRSQQMEPIAYKHWVSMRDSAMNDGISLLLVSAFRSVEYQATIVEKKLEKKLAMDEILSTSAAPGYSEHHTGRAIDLTTVDCPPLIEAFDETQAHQWLCDNAKQFGFVMSYPKDADNKIIYEPWHWMLVL